MAWWVRIDQNDERLSAWNRMGGRASGIRVDRAFQCPASTADAAAPAVAFTVVRAGAREFVFDATCCSALVADRLRCEWEVAADGGRVGGERLSRSDHRAGRTNVEPKPKCGGGHRTWRISIVGHQTQVQN